MAPGSLLAFAITRLPCREAFVRALIVSVVVAWYVPWLPEVPGTWLDHGWRLALGIACERGFVFGVDLVFTFGPYGCFAVRQYWPATYLPSLLFWGVISALVADLALPRSTDRRSIALALLGVLWLGLVPDAALTALPLAYVLHADRQRARTPTSCAALVAMGPLALVKFSVLPVCIAAAALGAVARGSSMVRGALIDGSIVGAAIVMAWVAHGQPLAALDDYLLNSIDLTRGYVESMAWPTLVTRQEPLLAVLEALFVLSAGAAFVCCAWPHGSAEGPLARRLAWPAFALVMLAVTVRHATTRGDGYHLLQGFAFCGAFVLLASTVVPARRRVVMILASMCLVLMPHGGRRARADLIGRVSSAAMGVSVLIRAEDPRHVLEDDVERAIALFRSVVDLRPRIDGTFDIIGHDQFLLLTLPSSQWLPRPVPQSYSAYTPRLAVLNAHHFASAQAPAWVVVRVHTIDGRWPLQDDARVWPQLRRHYVPVERLDPYLLLRRSAERAPGPAEVVTLDVRLADWADVPPPRAGSWYARFELPSACGGGLRALLWKPAPCHLEVLPEGASEPLRFRLVRAIAADGFLLSPMILDATALEAWLRGTPGDGIAVTQVRVIGDDGRPVPVTMRLSSLPFPPSAPH